MSPRNAVTMGLAVATASAVCALATFLALHSGQVQVHLASPAALLDIATGQLQTELVVLGSASLVGWLVWGGGRKNNRRHLRQGRGGRGIARRSSE